MALTPSPTENARIYIRTFTMSGSVRPVLYAQVGSEVWRFFGAPADAGATTQPNGTIVLATVGGVGRLGVAYGGRRWAQSTGDERFSLTWTPPLTGLYPEVPGSLWAYRLRSGSVTLGIVIALTTSQAVVGASVDRFAYLTDKMPSV